MTETEFIKWINQEKGLNITQSSNYSTMGKLGDAYMTNEDVNLYYGLSLLGYPPHLSLCNIFVDFGKTNNKVVSEIYSDFQTHKVRCFYSDELTNEDRYQILIKKKSLTIKL